MSDAVIGLIGVVVGGLLSSAASFVTTSSQARRQATRERRRAARLITNELRLASHTLGAMRDAIRDAESDIDVTLRTMTEQEAYAAPDPTRPASARLLTRVKDGWLPHVRTVWWDSHREPLAADLSRDDWQTVVLAYDRLEELHPLIDGLFMHHQVPVLGDRDRLERAIESTHKAIKTLNAFV